MEEETVALPPEQIVDAPDADIVGSATTVTTWFPEVAEPQPEPLHDLKTR